MNDYLKQYQAGRTEAVRQRAKRAQQQIESEIEENLGVYPFNGGRLTIAELCRRAHISNITLYGTRHRQTTKQEIEDWLNRIRTCLTTGRVAVRRRVTERADIWRERYLKSAQWIDHYHREEALNRRVVEDLKRANEALEQEIAKLRPATTGDNVHQIRRRR